MMEFKKLDAMWGGRDSFFTRNRESIRAKAPKTLKQYDDYKKNNQTLDQLIKDWENTIEKLSKLKE